MSATASATSRALNDLVEINKTATKGYQEAAEGVSSPELRIELLRFSQQRTQFAADLEQAAQRLGVAAPSEESTLEGALTDAAAALHRGWINLKAAITDHDDAAILGECETGDEAALQAYETALRSSELPVETRSVLQRQHGDILTVRNWLAQHKQPVL